MDWLIIQLIAIPLLLVIAGSAFVVSRRSGELEPGPPPTGGVDTLEREVTDATTDAPVATEAPPGAIDIVEADVLEVDGQVVEVDVTEIVVVPEPEAPTFRSRLARARSAFS